jgi:hypothetical protein
MGVYDTSKIISGLITFFALISFPIWYSAANGKIAYAPKPKIVTREKECIEPTLYMKDKHTDLLNHWRESAIREDNRTYVASSGKKYEISLTGTCMKCHPNKAEFCDQCHNYVGVKPNCWDCHVAPPKDL